MAKAGRQAESIVRLKVTLRGIRPPIWRRLLVPDRMTLGDLHHVIQAAMGWDDGHLHVFDIAGRQYSDPQAVEARRAQYIARSNEDVTPAGRVRDGIGILDVLGPIFPRADWLTDISGATGVDQMARDFTTLVEDPAVRAIILNIDSPGGAVNGVTELAGMIREARARKPIVAFVNGMIAQDLFPDLSDAELRVRYWPRELRPYDNLPAQTTPFVGRADERRALSELLDRPGCRLVTVTGPGGAGKTRLACEVAAAKRTALRHGVVFVPLGGLASGELLPAAVAEALEIGLTGRIDPLSELLGFLREKELLVVLDNFEHLTESAGIVAEMAEQAPGVRLLVTSRERLGLRAETLFPIEGMGLPSSATPSAANASDAVTLFVECARRLHPRFALDAQTRRYVVRICQLLEGIPLAIELASAWVRILSCAEILAELERGADLPGEHLRDRPERHRSLRATFDASWRLLEQDERRALACLSVFRGGFDRAAARAVASADLPLLRTLLDKSLLSKVGGRFHMLEMVRQYAAERLLAAVEEADPAKARHRDYFAALAAELEPHLRRAERQALARATVELANLRAAWSHGVETASVPSLLAAVDGLAHFYEARGWPREAAEAFARAADALGHGHESQSDVPRRLAAAKMAVWEGAARSQLGEHALAEELLRRGLAALREVGSKKEIALAALKLGANRREMGEYDEAEAALHEALALAGEASDGIGQGRALTSAGNLAYARGDYEEASRLYHGAVDLLRGLGDRSVLWPLNNLGVLAAVRKDYKEARRYFWDSMAVDVELGNQRGIATSLHNLALAAADAGELEEPRRHHQDCVEMCEQMGYRSMLALALVTMANLALRQGDAAGARAPLSRALQTAAAAHSYPVALEGLVAFARLRLAEAHPVGAAELLAVVLEHPASDEEAKQQARELMAEVEAKIGPAAAQDAASRAHAVDLDKLIARLAAGGKAAVPG
jgi:predicted ATPase